MNYPFPIQKLIDAFSRLPTIGPKTAERLVFHLLKQSPDKINDLANNLEHVRDTISQCSQCRNFTESDPCAICSDKNRRQEQLCVVAEPQDLQALERTHNWPGLYYVLNGQLAPLDGKGPLDIAAPQLIERIKSSRPPIKEIILAFNPDMDGETTVMYLAKTLKPLNVKITRLARGLPVGADLEYADEITLTEAIKNRREI